MHGDERSTFTLETMEAELRDLRAALGATRKSSNEVERIVLGQAEQRMKLRKFGEKWLSISGLIHASTENAALKFKFGGLPSDTLPPVPSSWNA